LRRIKHAGRESQIDAEGTIDLSDMNQKPTISASGVAGNGWSHGGSVARRGVAGIARAVEGGQVSEREGLGVGFDPQPG
jgi:hypothetical protein